MRSSLVLAVVTGVVVLASCSPDDGPSNTSLDTAPPTAQTDVAAEPRGAGGDNGAVMVFDSVDCTGNGNASKVTNPFSIGGAGFDSDQSGQLSISTQPGGVEAYTATITTSASGAFCEAPISLPDGKYKVVFAFGNGTGKQKVFSVSGGSATTTDPPTTDTDPPTTDTDPPTTDTDPPTTDTDPPTTDTDPPTTDTDPPTTETDPPTTETDPPTTETDPTTTTVAPTTTTSMTTAPELSTTTTIVDSGGGVTTSAPPGTEPPGTDPPDTAPPDSSESGAGGPTTTVGSGGGEQPVTGGEHVVMALIAALITAAGAAVILLSRRPARSR